MRPVIQQLSVVVLCLVTFSAHSQLALFDEFGASSIDPGRWSAINSTPNSLNQSRTLESGALVLRARSWAPTSRSHPDRLGLAISRPIALRVSSIAAEVTLTGIQQKRCPAPTKASVKSYFRLASHWFRDRGSGAIGGQRGNVVADIVIGRGFGRTLTGNRLEIFARAYRCTDANCTRTQRLFEKKISNARLKRTYKLALDHYPDSERIRFSAGEQRLWFDYSPRDFAISPARGPAIRTIALVNDLATCSTSARASSAETTAIVNWVKVNSDALR